LKPKNIVLDFIKTIILFRRNIQQQQQSIYQNIFETLNSEDNILFQQLKAVSSPPTSSKFQYCKKKKKTFLATHHKILVNITER
jgi:hypothetical protein